MTISGRRIVVTGSTAAPRAIAAALTAAGANVFEIADAFDSEESVAAAVSAAQASLGGIDQVVHAWYPDSVLTAADFNELAEDAWAQGCEAGLAGAWWLARQAIPSLLSSRGSLVFVIPTLGMSGGAGFTMLASIAEGIRVLAKGCGRQLGAEGVTVNTIATANHLWLPTETADALTAATTLSKPAFGRPGEADADIAPLVALLGEPEAHFATAGTVVADGGIWMGL
jgi:NAD(P)-dependent dehydrogenase (short-subunit alcohol dehydrogenase family)